VQDRAQRVHVGAGVHELHVAEVLFWRHVPWCPHHPTHPGPGRPIVGHVVDDSVVGLRGRRGRRPAGEDLGDAPVQHQHLAERADHHVGRLQISMHHSPGVRVADGVAHLREHVQLPPQRGSRGVGEVRGERASADLLHREPRAAVVGHPRVVHRRDVGVLELSRHARLAAEPLDELHPLLEPRPHDLVGARPPEDRVLDPPDLTHPPFAEGTQVHIAVSDDAARPALLPRVGGRVHGPAVVFEEPVDERLELSGDVGRQPVGLSEGSEFVAHAAGYPRPPVRGGTTPRRPPRRSRSGRARRP
jgi:hypothetical protein